jgi:hypothetical protein
MKRLCFLSPDLDHARKAFEDLKKNGIPEQHIYAIAKYGVELEDLPDAGSEADDFLPAYERGLALGGTSGLLAGLFALAFPPANIVIGGGLVLLVSLFGAGLGGIMSGIAGASYANSRLAKFESAINEGKILVMADVPKVEVENFQALIKQLDPDVEIEGIEPPATLIPK